MKRTKPSWLIILVAIYLLIIIGSRCLSYVFVPIPLWYDPGMYRDFILASFHALPNIHLGQFASRIKYTYEPALGLLTNIPLLIGYSVDTLLMWGMAIMSILTSIFVYMASKKYSKRAGYIAMLLFLLSIIQYQTFWRWYLKQIIGIILMLCTFTLLEKKKYRISLPLLIMLLAINRPGGIFFLIVYGIRQLITLLQNQKNGGEKISLSCRRMLFVAAIATWILYLPVIKEQIGAMITPMFGSIFIDWTSGTFFTIPEFIAYEFLFVVLSLRGVYTKIKHKERDWRLIGWMVGAIRVALGLFFYNRIAIYRDIFIILMAAYGLQEIFRTKKVWTYRIWGGLLLLQSIGYLCYVGSMSFPLISQAELEKIQQIDRLIPDNSIIMVTNEKYSAFVQGWTDKDILAPGLFDLDKWNQQQWDTRHQWDGSKKCEMLQEYVPLHRPIYLWIGRNQPVENFKEATCFTILENGWNYLFLQRTPPS